MAERVRAISTEATSTRTIKRKYSESEDSSNDTNELIKNAIVTKTKRTDISPNSEPESHSQTHSSSQSSASPDSKGTGSSPDSCSKTTGSSPDSMERQSSPDMPSNTSSWNAASTEHSTGVASIYNIAMTGSTDLCVLLHLGFGDVYTAIRNQDLKSRVLEECLNFAFDSYFFSGDNFTVITDINKLAAANVNFNELSKPVESSKLYRHFVTEGCCCEHFKEQGENQLDMKTLYRNTCSILYPKLQAFSDNLLNLLDDEKKSERKFQQLFMSFALLCGLRIFDGTDTSFSLKCNQKIISSTPDALVKGFGLYKDTDGLHFVTKVVAVVEAKRTYEKEEDEIRAYDLRNRTTLPHPCASHVDEHVKAQHIDEMLAVVQSGQSLFRFRGIYGLIVQGTKVTLVYYKGTEQYFQQISHGKSKLTAEVLYSNPFNILARDGRRNLISLLLDMENLTRKEMDKECYKMFNGLITIS